MPSLPPLLPGLEAVGDLQNLGTAGPSQAGDIRGDIKGGATGGPSINIATGGGTVSGSTSKNVLIWAFAALAVYFYFSSKKGK